MAGILIVVLLCAHELIATDNPHKGSSDLYGRQRGGTSELTQEAGAAEHDQEERILNKGEPASLSDYKLDCTESQWYVGADGRLKECEGSENTKETINGQGIVHEQEIRHVYLPRLPTAGLPVWSSLPMNNLWGNQFPGYPYNGQIDEEFDKKKPIEPHGEVQVHKPTLELKPVIAKPIVVHKPVVVWKPIVIKPVHKPIKLPVHAHKHPVHNAVKPVDHWHIPLKPHKPHKPHKGHHKPGHHAVVGGSHQEGLHPTGHVVTFDDGKDTIPEEAQLYFDRPIFFPFFQSQSIYSPLPPRLDPIRRTEIPEDERVVEVHPDTLYDKRQSFQNDSTEHAGTERSEVSITPKPGGERMSESPETRHRIINALIQPATGGTIVGMPGMIVRSMFPNIVQGIRFRQIAAPQLAYYYRSKLPFEEALTRVKSVINESIKPTKFVGVQQFVANQKLREYISGNTNIAQGIRVEESGEGTTERQGTAQVQKILDDKPRQPVEDKLAQIKSNISASSEPLADSHEFSVQAREDPPQEVSTQEHEEVREVVQPVDEELRLTEEGPVIPFLEQDQPVEPEESQAKIYDQENDAIITTSLPSNSHETSEDEEATTNDHLQVGRDILEDAEGDQETHGRKYREAPAVPIGILNDERETILGRTTLLEIMSALKEQYMKNAEPDQRKLIEDAFDRLHYSVRNMKDLDDRPAKKVYGPKKAALELLAETTQPLMDESDYYSDAADDASAEPSFLELLNVATKHKGKSHDSDGIDA